MKMYPCPHCDQPGISLVQRSMLNPGRPVACQSCGKKIGISLLHTVRAMLFFVPVVVVVHAVFEGSVLLTTLVCLGIGLALTPLFFHFVPLERR